MADTTPSGPRSITFLPSVPLPPSIPFVNTGYVVTPDGEDAVGEYNYMDPTDGEPLISAETSDEDKRACKAYTSRGQDVEVVANVTKSNNPPRML
ncbi:hypothetical protein PSPO01_07887 [Paraphaeosphaeria sporulosa]